MRKKEFILLGAAVLLGVAYVHYFGHWFDKRPIGISASIRPNRRPGGPPFFVVFNLNDDYQLTKLKVVPLTNGTPDAGAVPPWNLVTDSNSPPLRAFRYGQKIKGMKPVLAGTEPAALEPGAAYRLELTALNAAGSRDFRANLPTP